LQEIRRKDALSEAMRAVRVTGALSFNGDSRRRAGGIFSIDIAQGNWVLRIPSPLLASIQVS
jgi:hypothetical protein